MILLWILNAAGDVPPRRRQAPDCTVEQQFDATEEGQSCIKALKDSTACSTLAAQGHARCCTPSYGEDDTRTKTEHTPSLPHSPETPRTPEHADAPSATTPPDNSRCAAVTGGSGASALLAMPLGILRRRSDDI